jgi:hypothetical protein
VFADLTIIGSVVVVVVTGDDDGVGVGVEVDVGVGVGVELGVGVGVAVDVGVGVGVGSAGPICIVNESAVPPEPHAQVYVPVLNPKVVKLLFVYVAVEVPKSELEI